MSLVLVLTEQQARVIAATCPDAHVRDLVARAESLEGPRAVLLVDVGRGLELGPVQYGDSATADRMFDRLWKHTIARGETPHGETARPAGPGRPLAGDDGAGARGRRDVARRPRAAAAGRAVSRRRGAAPVQPVPADDSRDTSGDQQ